MAQEIAAFHAGTLLDEQALLTQAGIRVRGGRRNRGDSRKAENVTMLDLSMNPFCPECNTRLEFISEDTAVCHGCGLGGATLLARIEQRRTDPDATIW